MKLCVLDGYCLNPGDLSWSALEELVDVTVHERTPAESVVARASGAQLVMTNKTPLSRETLAQLPELRYIGVLATGYNIVDVAAAKERGVVVTNIPTYGTMSVAQHAIALLLELCIQAGEHSRHAKAGGWAASKDWSYWHSPLIELAGKTLGVVGFGRIGRATAKIGDALGMRILAHDTYHGDAPAYEGFQWAGVGRTAGRVRCRHAALPAHRGQPAHDRRGAIAADEAKRVSGEHIARTAGERRRPGGGIERGSDRGRGARRSFGGASEADNPLFTAKNCLITPHIAWATREARARLMETAVENVKAFLDGRPQNTV